MFGTKKSEDYDYIKVFIGFLEKIVDIILKLLNGLSAGGSETPEAPEEETPAAGE